MLTYTNQTEAISALKERFFIPPEHHKADAFIRQSKDFFVLRKFLETDAPLIRYPLEIEYCDGKDGWPDFIVSFNGLKVFVEVTEITDAESQRLFQGKRGTDNMGILGTIDLTAAVKERVASKNSKREQYALRTGINQSVLLLDHNKLPPFSYGAPGDELRLDEIITSFDFTFLLAPVYETDKNYIELNRSKGD